jgi:hypothetical protein
MTRYCTLTIIFFFAFITLQAADAPKLSDKATISILTCSAGDQMYSYFGHSAIRVCDSEQHIDLVFNYGTFDFNTPNFYLKFANGQLNYMLSVGRYKHFLQEYFRDNRAVIEQVLNLESNDKQRIFDALILNYQPENRFYKYDFFYDNCATRIFDIVVDNIDAKVKLGASDQNLVHLSFRDYLHHYLKNLPWTETGLNMILGLPADKIASLRESTYLPDFLLDVYDHASLHTSQGEIFPLVKEKISLLEMDQSQSKSGIILSPFWFFGVLLAFVVFISIWLPSNKILFQVFDRILFLLSGFIGLLISYLWLITDHSVTANNLNILWALPTFILLAFSNTYSQLTKGLLKINLGLLLVFLTGWYFIPQAFPLATIPIAMLLLFRIVMRLKQNRGIMVVKG